MAEHFLVVVYDVSDDRRRTRLHDRLLTFGVAVQYSVFECRLPDDRLPDLHRTIQRTIAPRRDRVRIYRLCTDCVGRTTATTGPEAFTADAVVVV